MRNHPGLSDAVMRAVMFAEKNLPIGENFALQDRLQDDGSTVYEISLIRHTQETARALMSSLPHAFWKKEYRKDLKWWEMKALIDGVVVRVWGMDDTPPTCRMVARKVVKKERVAVAYEEREVEVEEFDVVCDPEPEATEEITEGAVDVTA